MNEQLTRFEEKLDRVQESINQVRMEQLTQRSILARNTDDVEKHIKRTELLEKEVLFPVRALRWVVTGVIAGAGAFATIYGVVKLFS